MRIASSGVCLGSGFERSYGNCCRDGLFKGIARLTGTAFVVGIARGGFGIFAMALCDWDTGNRVCWTIDRVRDRSYPDSRVRAQTLSRAPRHTTMEAVNREQPATTSEVRLSSLEKYTWVDSAQCRLGSVDFAIILHCCLRACCCVSLLRNVFLHFVYAQSA